MMLAALSRSWYASSKLRETMTPFGSSTYVPGTECPPRGRLPHDSGSPTRLIVFDPWSDSIGNVMPCLSANARNVAVES